MCEMVERIIDDGSSIQSEEKGSSVRTKRRRTSSSDLKQSIQLAYEQSEHGRLSSSEKETLASAFHLSPQDVNKMFENRRSFVERKIRNFLISSEVLDIYSPQIEHVAVLARCSARRVRECFMKYSAQIIRDVQLKCASCGNRSNTSAPATRKLKWVAPVPSVRDIIYQIN